MLLDIGGLVRPFRHVRGRQVGNGGEAGLHSLGKRLFLGFELGQASLERRNLGLQRLGCRGIALAHRGADRLACLVAAREPFLQRRRDGAPAGILVQNRGAQRLQPTAGETGIEGGRIVADEADVVHGGSPMHRRPRAIKRGRVRFGQPSPQI